MRVLELVIPIHKLATIVTPVNINLKTVQQRTLVQIVAKANLLLTNPQLAVQCVEKDSSKMKMQRLTTIVRVVFKFQFLLLSVF